MTKGNFIFMLFMLVSLGLPSFALSAAVTLDASNPSYTNERYGFSVSLPPGNYKAKESSDGDGVTIRDGKGFTLYAYGTKSFVVFEKSFNDAVFDIKKEFDSIVETVTQPENNTFFVTGLKGSNLIHVKCILGEHHANILRITHGKSVHDEYEPVCTKALDSFK